MKSGQAIEGVRRHEHQVAVRHRQQFRQPGLAPGVAGLVLALLLSSASF
jgi:hypothetical protein